MDIEKWVSIDGYESTYENELMIEVRSGVVISQFTDLGRVANRL